MTTEPNNIHLKIGESWILSILGGVNMYSHPRHQDDGRSTNYVEVEVGIWPVGPTNIETILVCPYVNPRALANIIQWLADKCYENILEYTEDPVAARVVFGLPVQSSDSSDNVPGDD